LDYRSKILSFYDLLPFRDHPLWRAVLSHELTLNQILQAEIQHYLRTKAGQALRQESALNAPPSTPGIFEAALSNYLEEVAPNRTHPSHLDLIKRLLLSGGIPAIELDKTALTPGNSAAIALYRDIANRGPACHLIGAGAVEFYYSSLAPEIYKAYTSHYGMTSSQAETYQLHGPMDAEHAGRALSVLDEAIELHGWDVIETSVRDAFVATSLHYDGMLQAALGRITYWDGGVQ
jgi:pyrroloquinoline quinone (PQQ) biosynthesis protein C